MIGKLILSVFGLLPPPRPVDQDIGAERQKAALAIAQHRTVVDEARAANLDMIQAQRIDERQAMRQDADHLREATVTFMDRFVAQGDDLRALANQTIDRLK